MRESQRTESVTMEAGLKSKDGRNKEDTILVSVPRLDIIAMPGEQPTRRIHFHAADENKLNGFAVSMHRRILLASNRFSGIENSLLIGIDTIGLPEGAQIESELVVVTDQGERRIPIKLSIMEKESREGRFLLPTVGKDEGAAKGREVESLEDFTLLAKENAGAAFAFFLTPAFLKLKGMEEGLRKVLYRSLMRPPVTYRQMEMFLVSAGLKEKIVFSTDHKEMIFPELPGTERGEIKLYRSTWGHVRLDVQVEGNFIECTRKKISSEDFVGGECTIEYLVHGEQLTNQLRSGSIRLLGDDTLTKVDISASGIKKEKHIITRHQERARLWKLLLQRSLHEISDEEWASRSLSLIDEIMEKDAVILLFEAYIKMESGDRTGALEALWPLKENEITTDGLEENGAYLVLAKALELLPEERRNILPRIVEFRKRMPESALLFYLYRKVGERKENDEQLLRRLEECYEAGSRSPFLFAEAWMLLSNNENLLKRLTDFILHTFLFAMRRSMFAEKLMQRFVFLSHNLKKFSQDTYRLLVRIYESMHSDEAVEAICALVIKGQPIRAEYFRWYAEAVERDIRITHIFEYYIETAPMNRKELPPLPVLLYFSGNEIPGETRKAHLYSQIVSQYHPEQQIYRMYESKMKQFALQSLQKGRINEDFALLYQMLIGGEDSGREAALMAGVQLFCKIEVEDAQKVHPYTEGLKEEIDYIPVNGIVYIPIYSEHTILLLEDAERKNTPYALPALCVTMLFPRPDAKTICMKQRIEHSGLLLFACEQENEITEENLPLFRKAERCEQFTEEYRFSIRERLLAYYLSHPEEMSRYDFVRKMNPTEYLKTDKNKTVELLLQEGIYDTAFALLSEFGYEQIQKDQLLRLAGRLVLEKDYELDEELLCLCQAVYEKQCFNDIILTYLQQHMEGATAQLCTLWERMGGFSLDRHRLSEKILKQAVMTGILPKQGPEIAGEYAKEQGSRKVLSAYLTMLAHEYVPERLLFPAEVIGIVEELLGTSLPVSLGCKIALLHYYAKSGISNERQYALADRLLNYLCEREIRFAFYKNLPRDLAEKYMLSDKIFIEARPEAATNVILHFKVGNTWRTERLHNRYRGLYVKEMQLFYGEAVPYYLEYTKNGSTVRTEEQILTPAAEELSGDTKYHLLNQMRKAQSEENVEQRDAAAYVYAQREALVHHFFGLKENKFAND